MARNISKSRRVEEKKLITNWKQEPKNQEIFEEIFEEIFKYEQENKPTTDQQPNLLRIQ